MSHLLPSNIFSTSSFACCKKQNKLWGIIDQLKFFEYLHKSGETIFSHLMYSRPITYNIGTNEDNFNKYQGEFLSLIFIKKHLPEWHFYLPHKDFFFFFFLSWKSYMYVHNTLLHTCTCNLPNSGKCYFLVFQHACPNLTLLALGNQASAYVAPCKYGHCWISQYINRFYCKNMNTWVKSSFLYTVNSA